MRKICFAAFAVSVALGICETAQARDGHWNGWYAGVSFGGGGGLNRNSSPGGPPSYGDQGSASSLLAGVQLGHNWQIGNGRTVIGVEGSLSAVKSTATHTCLTSDPLLLSANCTIDHDAMASLTARIGHVIGEGDRTLLFLRAGAAWLRSTSAITNGGTTALAPEVQREVNAGWTIGAGLEHAVGPRWSVVASYDLAQFKTSEMNTPTRFQQFVPGVIGYDFYPGTRASHEFTMHMFRLGLNYRLGAPGSADEFAPLLHRTDVVNRGWTAEVGARYWLSGGRFQKDLGITVLSAMRNNLISRLTYDSEGHSGEAFARVDAPTGYFIKGYAGGGILGAGKMIDEDWLLDEGTPYSATSSNVTGSIAYASVDLGYTVNDYNGLRLGAFAGYHFLREKQKAWGCTQFGYPGVTPPCGGSSVPTSMLVITEDSDWHSVRIGAVADVKLTDRLTFTAEAAWVPYTRLKGLDGHVARTDVSNVYSDEFGTGQGVQLEALLSMRLMPRLSMGIGARYWNLWSENAVAEAFGDKCPNCPTLPSRTERFGVFFQTSYALGKVPSSKQ